MSLPRYVRVPQKEIQNRAKEAIEGVIYRPIPEEFKVHFSADDYADGLSTVLGTIDIFSTWGPRYSALLASILSGSGKMGSFIDFTSKNPIAALVFYLAVGIAAGKNLYDHYQFKAKVADQKHNTHLKLRQALQAELKEEAKETVESYNRKLTESVRKMNEIYRFVLDNDPASKYKNIEIILPDPFLGEGEEKEEKIDRNSLKTKYTFKPQFQDQPQLGPEKPGRIRNFINKITAPLYAGIGLASFTYWILFISLAVSVGTFAAAGIAGLSPLVAFGLPSLAVAPYFGVKLHNYMKNRDGVSDEHARLVKIVDNESSTIADKVVKRLHYTQEVERLENINKRLATELQQEEDSPLSLSQPIPMPSLKALGINKHNQAIAAAFTTTVAQTGMAQYSAWIVTDFLKIAVGVAVTGALLGNIIGGVLIAIGFGLGLKEGYDKYQTARKQEAAEAKLPTTQSRSLTQIWQDRIEELKDLNSSTSASLNRFRSQGLITPILPEAPDNKQDFEPPAATTPLKMIYNFFDWGTTGIFFARLFFTLGGAIFLPFTPLILAPPLAIGLLALSGLSFGAAKYYQAKQTQKEDHAQEYVSKIKSLDEKIHIAKLTNKYLALELLKLTPGRKATPDDSSSPSTSPTSALEPTTGNDSAFTLKTPRFA